MSITARNLAPTRAHAISMYETAGRVKDSDVPSIASARAAGKAGKAPSHLACCSRAGGSGLICFLTCFLTFSSRPAVGEALNAPKRKVTPPPPHHEGTFAAFTVVATTKALHSPSLKDSLCQSATMRRLSAPSLSFSVCHCAVTEGASLPTIQHGPFGPLAFFVLHC